MRLVLNDRFQHVVVTTVLVSGIGWIDVHAHRSLLYIRLQSLQRDLPRSRHHFDRILNVLTLLC
ncbi:hypothetical protein WJ29_00855 [Burkholderia ubonensis]|nr:hypothetical protein WJ29_00855 [Burkholderia ubonensis]